MEHAPGKAVKRKDGWHMICVCGDEYCAEDWDYDATYLMYLPEGVSKEDLSFIHKADS